MNRAYESMYPSEGTSVSRKLGITLLDHFALELMKQPVSEEEIGREMTRDKNKNPYNTMDKPTPRSRDRIIADIAVRRAKALLASIEASKFDTYE